MSIPMFIIDAFAERGWRGNPAAVCLLDDDRPADWMQTVANEMNLSETAFLRPCEGGFSLRWFTPEVEVDLCGHATLASAHALWTANRISPSTPARFHTRSGWLTATSQADLIRLDFPSMAAEVATPPSILTEALGAPAVWIGFNGMDYLVELEDAAAVRRLSPDLGKLATLSGRGAIVTARSDHAEFDFVSRFFAPGAGVSEDPVTGSAHCALAPFWAPRLGKKEMVGFQASRRGGVVHVRLADDRVYLSGRAKMVVRGELCM